MKFLILIALALAIVWLIRGLRKPSTPPAQNSSTKVNEEMVTCVHCGIHLPRSEALPGRGGVFCGEAHRRAFESGGSD